MAVKTLSQFRQDARAKADLHEDGGAVPDSVLDGYINEGLGELYDLLITADDARTFAKNAPVPPKVGQFSFRLPWDFYRLVSLHIRRGSHWERAERADSSKYAELADNKHLAQMGIPQYFIRWDMTTGERFAFVFPEQKNGEDVAIVYFPQPPRLELASDSIDNPSDWMEFVTLTAAIKALNSLERNAEAFMLEKKEAARRIKKAVRGLDLHQPYKVRKWERSRRLPGHWH